MVNLKIRKFEQAIITFVNASQLPIEVKRLCLLDILNQVSQAAEQEVYVENAKEQKESKPKMESEES